MIGKSESPRCSKQVKSLPVHYSANKKAWMTFDLFEAEMRHSNWDCQLQKRKFLLLVDGSRGDKKSQMPLPLAHIIGNNRMH